MLRKAAALHRYHNQSLKSARLDSLEDRIVNLLSYSANRNNIGEKVHRNWRYKRILLLRLVCSFADLEWMYKELKLEYDEYEATMPQHQRFSPIFTDCKWRKSQRSGKNQISYKTLSHFDNRYRYIYNPVTTVLQKIGPSAKTRIKNAKITARVANVQHEWLATSKKRNFLVKSLARDLKRASQDKSWKYSKYFKTRKCEYLGVFTSMSDLKSEEYARFFQNKIDQLKAEKSKLYRVTKALSKSFERKYVQRRTFRKYLLLRRKQATASISTRTIKSFKSKT
jgi:hypothetical protein